MPCNLIPSSTPLLSLVDLRNHLNDWLSSFPAETQLDGGTDSNQSAWVAFRFTPPALQGAYRPLWKLNGDTKREAVKRFVDGKQLTLETTKEGGRCLRIAADVKANGWSCFEVK